MMPQARRYNSNAERQAAYRARLADRRALAGTDAAVKRLRDLEDAFADAERRAAAAEARADRADERRRQSDAARREAETHRHAEPQVTVDARLHMALERIADLGVLIDELSQRLAVAEGRTLTGPAQPFSIGSSDSPTGPNRAERRRSERQQQRRR